MATRVYVMPISNPAAAGAAMVRHKRAPLFHLDRGARSAVEEAERWGERVLQPVPRRLFRYLVMTNEAARIWMGREVMGLPGTRALQVLFMPVIRRLAKLSHADEPTVRADLARLTELLDHVDGLIAEGTIGGADPNAADFQLLASVRVLLEFEDLAQQLEGRTSARAARRLYPDWPGPIPRGLPPAPCPGRGGAQLSDGSAGIVATSR